MFMQRERERDRWPTIILSNVTIIVLVHEHVSHVIQSVIPENINLTTYVPQLPLLPLFIMP